MSAKILYKAEPAGDLRTLEEAVAYFKRELDNLERAFILALQNPLDELHAAPAKVFTGLTVLADGTDWNPGSGQGVYTYYAGAWHKLG